MSAAPDSWQEIGTTLRCGGPSAGVRDPVPETPATIELVDQWLAGGWRVARRVPTPVRIAVILLWAGMIFVLSNQPGLHASDDPGVDLPLRHIAHILVYAVLTALIGWLLTGSGGPSRRTIMAAGSLAFVYGITDEWHQTFVPSRTGRPEDLIWDGIGMLIGAAFLWLTGRVTRRMTGRGSGALSTDRFPTSDEPRPPTRR